jgi:hypothetical protein
MSKEYHVCHSCQLSGMNNCSEFDRCGCDTSYPIELREMMKEMHEKGVSLSIIAEKAFDMGKSYQSIEKDLLK